jgi:hypothetical protein
MTRFRSFEKGNNFGCTPEVRDEEESNRKERVSGLKELVDRSLRALARRNEPRELMRKISEDVTKR